MPYTAADALAFALKLKEYLLLDAYARSGTDSAARCYARSSSTSSVIDSTLVAIIWQDAVPDSPVFLSVRRVRSTRLQTMVLMCLIDARTHGERSVFVLRDTVKMLLVHG